MLSAIVVIASLGLVISAYAYFVEQKMKQDHTYKPMCDISDRISCSKPFASRYGALLGVANSLVSAFFYLVIILLAFLGMKKLIFLVAIVACCASLVFAYILFVKIRVFCVVCFSIYVIDGLLLWLSWPL